MNLKKYLIALFCFTLFGHYVFAQKKGEKPFKEEVYKELKNLRSNHQTIYKKHLLPLIGQDLDEELFSFLSDVLKTQRLYESRVYIVSILTKDKSISVQKKADLLLWGLEAECTYPLLFKESEDISFQEGYCGSPSEWLKEDYARGLSELGSSVIPFLKTELNKNKSLCVKGQLIVALGWLKDTSVFQRLLWLLKNSPSGYTRAAVAQILRTGYEHQEVISNLKQALKDQFKLVCNRGDVQPACSVSKCPDQYTSYPVRHAACESLRLLGVACFYQKGKVIYEEGSKIKKVK